MPTILTGPVSSFAQVSRTVAALPCLKHGNRHRAEQANPEDDLPLRRLNGKITHMIRVTAP